MFAPAVGFELHKLRSGAFARLLDCKLGDSGHVENVVAVTHIRGDTVCFGNAANFPLGLSFAYMYIAGIGVVFADKNHGKILEFREIHRLMENAFFKCAIAKIHDAYAVFII